MRSLCRTVFWAKHFSDSHCNFLILRGFEYTADIFYSREEVQFLTLGLKITLQWSKSWRMSRGGMIGRERGWTGTLLILTMVAQWKKMLQNKPAFIQSIFGKNYDHLELSSCLKTFWKQDTAPKHFEPVETWNEFHLIQPQTSALWLSASEPRVPLSLEREHTSGMCNPADPLWTSTAGWKEEHEWSAHSVPAESKWHL